jgi:histone deacetylase 11
MKTAIVYNENYNFKIPASLARLLHKFDSAKYRRAFELFNKMWEMDHWGRTGNLLEKHVFSPEHEITQEDIAAVHTESYLESLTNPQIIARIIESWPLSFLSAKTLDERLLSPMRWAVSGTSLAMEKVLQDGYSIAFNLGGGYHHAFPDHGEGFCVYNDLAIGLNLMKRKALLKEEDVVAVVDMDAHFGNGNAAFFGKSKNVKFFDIHNVRAYAAADGDEYEDNRWLLPIWQYASGVAYALRFSEKLPNFLDTVNPKILFYLAGTDVIKGDSIGRLALSPRDVYERDRYVLRQAKERSIPVVVVTAGGYTSQSYKMVAETADLIQSRNFRDE